MKDNGRFIPREAVSIPETRRVAPPTTFRKLLEVGDGRVDPVFDANVTVSKTASHKGSAYTLDVEYPYKGAELFKLLNEIAPSDAFMSIGGVVADWQMPDDAAMAGRTRSQRLLAIHERLKEVWSIFEGHRHAFLMAISFPRLEDIQRIVNSRIRLQDEAKKILENGARKQQIDRRVGEIESGFSEEEFNKSPQYQAIFNFMKDNPRQGRRVRKKPESVVYRFKKLPPRQRRDLYLRNKELFDLNINVSEEALQDFATENGWVKFDIKGETLYFGRDLGEYDFFGTQLIQRENEIDIAVGGKKKIATLRLNPDPTKPNRIEISMDSTLDAISPGVVWENDGEKRTFNFQNGFVNNPLLGFLLLPYLEPMLHTGWPKKVGLPEGRFQQDMGPAQVPVLALMYKDVIAKNSDVLKRAEQYVEKTGIDKAV